ADLVNYGTKMIAGSTLEAVDNDYSDRDYEVHFTIPEFTCLAPQSGFPDFAVIDIRYIPNQKLVELKSLTLYINKFRDQEVFHEGAVNRILDDLVALLQPRWIEVVGDFNVRGNIKTVITARHVAEGYSPNGRG
ncbi:MAG TPA: preQ(1) synthase, partial [Candidatus Dormibacteraeota bacterium]|nr:preQ(1) synthase [Candidatus Dormibacteraeota bacterium]